jgi:hypothetical protein
LTEVPQSIQLLARLADVVARPADFWPADMTGLATLPPTTVASLYKGRSGALFQRALAADMKLSEIEIGDNFMVELRTVPDVAGAVRIASAPIEEIMTALRHLAAAIYCKAVNGAVRKADRDAMHDMLGADGLLTAQRQAEVFWPSLAQLASLDARLIGNPIAEPPSTDGPWKRPGTSLAIAGKPLALQHAYGILLAYVGAISETVTGILRARLGDVAGDFAATPVSARQTQEIRDLLERKAPTWSTTIA